MIAYKATFYSRGAIEAVEVQGFTQASVRLFGGRLERIDTGYQFWSPTKEGAKQWLLNRAKSNLATLQLELSAANENLARIEKL